MSIDYNNYESACKNYVNHLDEIISQLHNELKEKFFANIDERDLNGKVEVPLYDINNNSDYLVICREIDLLKNRISVINRKLNTLHYDLIISNNSVRLVNPLDEQKRLAFEKMEREKLENEKEVLDAKLHKIVENPKRYIRYLEFLNGDYSKIRDKEVIKELKTIEENIKTYKDAKKTALKTLSCKRKKSSNEKKLKLNNKKY